jgi:glycosyltransferase involved in cell wall biosynthesis
VSEPAVTVVIPTRNRWERLKRSLGGALRQSDVDLEVVVVDDASDSKPPAALSPRADPRVRLVRNPTQRGVAYSRNRGTEEAAAAWVAFLDDDDLWSPAKLARQLAVARTSGADLVYSAAVLLGPELEVLRLVPAPSPDALKAGILVQNILPAGQSNVLVRRELVEALGGFDERFSMIADWELWIRLLATAKVAPCQEVHVGYVLHLESMQVRDSRSETEFTRIAELHMRDPAIKRRAQIIGVRWRAYNHRRAGRRLNAAEDYLRAAVRYRAPGMAMRAAGALMGERIMSMGRRPPSISLPWLEEYARETH